MSDASTSLDEDMDNNSDQGDNMDTSSDEVSRSRLEEDGGGSDTLSTSTNEHHGSDNDIDDGDEGRKDKLVPPMNHHYLSPICSSIKCADRVLGGMLLPLSELLEVE
jgi:hypothetical protein